MYGVDISDLQRDLANAKQMLSYLYNAKEISLSKLKENEHAAQLAGLNVDDIDFYLYIPGESNVAIDDKDKDETFPKEEDKKTEHVNQILAGYNEEQENKDLQKDIGIDPKLLESDNGTYISGSEGTSGATFNQIIGENCDYYKVFQTSGGELSIVGFRNGEPQKIDNTFLKSTSMNKNTITMLQNDGSIAEKDLVGCSRIGVTNQYIGIYMDGNKLSVCYARNGKDNLIGKDISGSSIHATNGRNLSNRLDTAINRDLTTEDKTADYVSNVNYIGSNTSPNNRDAVDLISASAEAYNVDAKTLQTAYDNQRPQNPKISDEDLIKMLAEQQQAEQQAETQPKSEEEPKEEENHWPGERVLGGNDHHRPPLF